MGRTEDLPTWWMAPRFYGINVGRNILIHSWDLGISGIYDFMFVKVDDTVPTDWSIWSLHYTTCWHLGISKDATCFWSPNFLLERETCFKCERIEWIPKKNTLFHTVDGGNPAPPGMLKTLCIMGCSLPTSNWLAGFLNHQRRTSLQDGIVGKKTCQFLASPGSSTGWIDQDQQPKRIKDSVVFFSVVLFG